MRAVIVWRAQGGTSSVVQMCKILSKRILVFVLCGPALVLFLEGATSTIPILFRVEKNSDRPFTPLQST
jgi:hypothetical protein